jgi:hypothetical protein
VSASTAGHPDRRRGSCRQSPWRRAALHAAIPTISVNGEVATRQECERGHAYEPRPRYVPERAGKARDLRESRNRAAPPNVRIVMPTVASSPGWAVPIHRLRVHREHLIADSHQRADH